MQAPRIVMIDDDWETTARWLSHLEAKGHSVLHLPQARAHAAEGVEGPAVLMTSLPPTPGPLLAALASRWVAPLDRAVLLLGGRRDHPLEIAALNAGADDVLFEPVDWRRLEARLAAVLRRIGPFTGDKPLVLSRRLTVDRHQREVRVGPHSIRLTMVEFDIFSELVSRRGEAVSREALYARIMNGEYNGVTRGIDVHISRIRSKLRRCGVPTSCIRSVRGVGYLLAA